MRRFSSLQSVEGEEAEGREERGFAMVHRVILPLPAPVQQAAVLNQEVRLTGTGAGA